VEHFIADGEKAVVERKARAIEPPTATIPPPSATAVQSTPPPARPTVYRRWWFWTVLGGVVVVGTVAGLAAALTPNDADVPATAGGNVVFP
jgi:hypothetical protein